MGNIESPKNNTVSAVILVDMFEKVIITHVELTEEMKRMCRKIDEATEATKEMTQAINNMPSKIDAVQKAVGLVKWGLLPIVATLALSLFGLVLDLILF